jgi:hypothetical protein
MMISRFQARVFHAPRNEEAVRRLPAFSRRTRFVRVEAATSCPKRPMAQMSILRKDSQSTFSSGFFGSAAAHGVTQKPMPQINRVCLTLVANFSSTNQRADSFSRPGVNLEAKV